MAELTGTVAGHVLNDDAWAPPGRRTQAPVRGSHRLALALARAAARCMLGWCREASKLANPRHVLSAISSVVGGRRLLALSFGLLMLAGCSQEQQREPDNWADLCKKTDCEQYPSGYATVQVDGTPTLYLPMLTVPILDVGRLDWLQRARSDGSLIRTLTTSGDIGKILVGELYPEEMMKAYDLFNVWPSRIDFPSEFIIHVVKKNRERFWFGEGTRAETFVGGRPDDGVVAKFLSSDMKNYETLNDDFIIVFQSKIILERPSNKSKYRLFGIYSKNPLVQGKHVLGLCGLACVFYTVSDGENQEAVHLEYNFGPMFDFGWLNIGPSIPSGSKELILTAVQCDAPNPLVTCDRMDRTFKDMPMALGLLDRMIDAIQQKPGL